MTDEQALRYWQELAGYDGPAWTEEAQSAGLLTDFRYKPERLPDVVRGFAKGDEVLPRLQDAFKAAFQPASLRRTAATFSHEQLLSWAHAWRMVLAEMLDELEDDEGWALRLRSLERGRVIEHDPDVDEEDLEALVVDVESQYFWWKATQEPIRLLDDSIFALVRNNPTVSYVLWPLAQEQSNLEDPYRHYFQLWEAGYGVSIHGSRAETLVFPLPDRLPFFADLVPEPGG